MKIKNLLYLLLLFIISLIITLMIGKIIQQPFIEGKLNTKNNGVYLSDIPAEFSQDLISQNIWRRTVSKQLEDPEKESGYLLEFRQEIKIIFPINVKFDHLQGCFSIRNDINDILNFIIKGDNDKILWENSLNTSDQKSLNVNLQLNNQRKLSFIITSNNCDYYNINRLDLIGFSITKNGEKPISSDYIENPEFKLMTFQKIKENIINLNIIWKIIIIFSLCLIIFFLYKKRDTIELGSSIESLFSIIIPLAIFIFLIIFPTLTVNTYDEVKKFALQFNIGASIPMTYILYIIFRTFINYIKENGIILGIVISLIDICISIFLILTGFGIVAMVLGILLVVVFSLFGEAG